MTVLRASDVDRFVSRPDPGTKAVLIYGPDVGAVRESACKIVRSVVGSLDDAFKVVRLTDQVLADDPDRLADEAQAISMLGGRRAIWITGAGNGFQKAVAQYLGVAETDSLIVAEADNLPKSSKLRTLFETAGNALAIPCYLDTRQNLHELIAKVMAEHKLTVAGDAQQRLAEILGNDRLMSRSELDKLALYCAGQETVTLEDINAVCGDESELTVDDMIDAAFTGEADQACSRFVRLADSGVSPARLLSVASTHVAKLQELCLSVDAGRNATQVVKSARPPIFFRRQPSIVRQLAIWQMADLERAGQTLQSATIQTRQFPALESEIAERSLLSLARSAQSSRMKNY